jgi:hypothetical protein
MGFTRYSDSESIEVPDDPAQHKANQRLAKTGSASAGQLSDQERLKLQADLADKDSEDGIETWETEGGKSASSD